MRGVIYKYTSPSGKIYIGQTKNEEERRKEFLDKNAEYAGMKMMSERFEYPNFEEWKYEVLEKYDTYPEKLKKVLDFREVVNILNYNSIEEGLNGKGGGDIESLCNNYLLIDLYLQSDVCIQDKILNDIITLPKISGFFLYENMRQRTEKEYDDSEVIELLADLNGHQKKGYKCIKEKLKKLLVREYLYEKDKKIAKDEIKWYKVKCRDSIRNFKKLW